MPTNISVAYDAIRSTMAATFPTYYELANPYFIEKDSELLFTTAWAVAIADGSNVNRTASCQLSVQRDFVVVLTRKFYITPHNAIQARVDTEKSLFEDHLTMISALTQMSGINLRWVQDNGLEFIKAGRTDLVMAQSIFSLEYFETLT